MRLFDDAALIVDWRGLCESHILEAVWIQEEEVWDAWLDSWAVDDADANPSPLAQLLSEA